MKSRRDRAWNQIFKLSVWCFNLHPANQKSCHDLSWALRRCPMACPTQTACFPGHPFPLPSAQLNTPCSPTVHPRGNYSNGSYGKPWVGKSLFWASCNKTEQLGRRSWNSTMMDSHQHAGFVCAAEPRVAAVPVQGAVWPEAATTQNFLQQVTRAALRQIIINLH